MLEWVQRAFGLAGWVVGVDIGLGESVGKAAEADTGPEWLVAEVGLTHTCHRTARNRQAFDHMTCMASSKLALRASCRTSPIMSLFLPRPHELCRSKDCCNDRLRSWKCSRKTLNIGRVVEFVSSRSKQQKSTRLENCATRTTHRRRFCHWSPRCPFTALSALSCPKSDSNSRKKTMESRSKQA